MAHTPGRMTVGLVLVLVSLLLAGASAVWDSSTRTELIDEASGQRGRMSVAAFDMYRALSDADAAITGAFLPGQSAKSDLRDAYEAGISRASAAVTVLADEATSKRQVEQVAELSAMLPAYTGLVETARSYHRQGMPLGIAYLRDASSLVREQMLPITQQLQSSSMEELTVAKDGAAGFPWVAALLGVIALGGLGYVQYRLAKRTNRVLNIGLGSATAALLVSLLWMLVSWASAAGHLTAGDENGTRPLAILSQAHISAQQARSDEALTLIAQGTDTDFEADFVEKLDELIGEDGKSGSLGEVRAAFTDTELSQHIDAAIEAATQWREAHTSVRELDDNGHYDEAVEAAIGVEAGQAGAAFAALNDALTKANDIAAERFTTETAAAGSALTATGIGFSVLALGAMAAALTGFTRRISEYR